MMTINQFNTALNALETVLNQVVKSIPYKSSLEAPSSYKAVCDFYNANGYFLIYSGSSDKTIFSNNEMNIKFRAYHDAGHYYNSLSFKFKDEKKLGKIQANELENVAVAMGYNLEIASHIESIVLAEINGQIEYYEKHNKYLEDQKAYILNLLVA